MEEQIFAKSTFITIPIRPITKKNHQKIAFNFKESRRYIAQSDPYIEYEKNCLWLLKYHKNIYFDMPVRIRIEYWMPDKKAWPDLIGLIQSTCDVLEKAGILENDRLVISFDGSKIRGIDKVNPRTDIWIEELKGKDAQIEIVKIKGSPKEE